MPPKTQQVTREARGLDLDIALLAAFRGTPIHVEKIQSVTGIPMADLTACLARLELAGQLKQLSAGRYIVMVEAGVPAVRKVLRELTTEGALVKFMGPRYYLPGVYRLLKDL